MDQHRSVEVSLRNDSLKSFPKPREVFELLPDVGELLPGEVADLSTGRMAAVAGAKQSRQLGKREPDGQCALNEQDAFQRLGRIHAVTVGESARPCEQALALVVSQRIGADPRSSSDLSGTKAGRRPRFRHAQESRPPNRFGSQGLLPGFSTKKKRPLAGPRVNERVRARSDLCAKGGGGDVVRLHLRRRYDEGVERRENLRIRRRVVGLGALAVFPKADADGAIRVDECQLVLETALLPEHRKDFVLEVSRELLLFPGLDLEMDVTCELHETDSPVLETDGLHRGSTEGRTATARFRSRRDR